MHEAADTAKFSAEESRIGTTVDIIIPVDIEAAQAFENPARRAAAGRYLGSLIKGGRARNLLAQAIAEAKQEATAKGLTDSEFDAELRVWQSERPT